MNKIIVYSFDDDMSEIYAISQNIKMHFTLNYLVHNKKFNISNTVVELQAPTQTYNEFIKILSIKIHDNKMFSRHKLLNNIYFIVGCKKTINSNKKFNDNVLKIKTFRTVINYEKSENKIYSQKL